MRDIIIMHSLRIHILMMADAIPIVSVDCVQ